MGLREARHAISEIRRALDAIEEDVEKLAASAPCDLWEHDGAVRCDTHGRIWGAVSRPDEPCKPVGGG